MEDTQTYVFNVVDITFQAVLSDKSLCSLSIIETAEERISPKHPVLDRLIAELEGYFAGTLQTFTIPLAPKGTDFQQKVWAQLQSIPYGKTLNYAQMAHKLGDPLSIRAAATANGKNPIMLLIPCHRVIGSDGSLTGYAGGLHNKKRFLDLENRVANGVLNLF
jgi:methylated-DNA-[protein]-cysteine S-methyltransferase